MYLCSPFCPAFTYPPCVPHPQEPCPEAVNPCYPRPCASCPPGFCPFRMAPYICGQCPPCHYGPCAACASFCPPGMCPPCPAPLCGPEACQANPRGQVPQHAPDPCPPDPPCPGPCPFAPPCPPPCWMMPMRMDFDGPDGRPDGYPCQDDDTAPPWGPGPWDGSRPGQRPPDGWARPHSRRPSVPQASEPCAQSPAQPRAPEMPAPPQKGHAPEPSAPPQRKACPPERRPHRGAASEGPFFGPSL